MKHVASIRKTLGFATIFNLLGPLCNPAGARRQMIGVGRRELHQTMAQVLALLGTDRSIVVHGTDGTGEVSLSTATEVIEVNNTATKSFVWQPEDFGLKTQPADALLIAGATESAALIRQILAGKPGPPRDVVVLNAAATLWTAGLDNSPLRCAEIATAAIDNGQAARLLADWSALTSQ